MSKNMYPALSAVLNQNKITLEKDEFKIVLDLIDGKDIKSNKELTPVSSTRIRPERPSRWRVLSCIRRRCCRIWNIPQICCQKPCTTFRRSHEQNSQCTSFSSKIWWQISIIRTDYKENPSCKISNIQYKMKQWHLFQSSTMFKHC